jgi:hypothetical protein
MFFLFLNNFLRFRVPPCYPFILPNYTLHGCWNWTHKAWLCPVVIFSLLLLVHDTLYAMFDLLRRTDGLLELILICYIFLEPIFMAYSCLFLFMATQVISSDLQTSIEYAICILGLLVSPFMHLFWMAVYYHQTAHFLPARFVLVCLKLISTLAWFGAWKACRTFTVSLYEPTVNKDIASHTSSFNVRDLIREPESSPYFSEYPRWARRTIPNLSDGSTQALPNNESITLSKVSGTLALSFRNQRLLHMLKFIDTTDESRPQRGSSPIFHCYPYPMQYRYSG